MLQEEDGDHYRPRMNPDFVRRVLERRRTEKAAKRETLVDESKERSKKIVDAAKEVRAELRKRREDEEAKRLSGKPT